MKIEHIAMYVNDPEAAKEFFITYLGGQSNKMYLSDTEKDVNRTGFIHIAFSVGSKANVDKLTADLKNNGYEVLSGPRMTGDGYYESSIIAIEGNLIEITI